MNYNLFTLKAHKPKRLPEANVQAEIYCQLKALNIEVILEYKQYVKAMNCFMRIDVAVIQGDRLITAIECKSRNRTRINENTRQHKKYMSLGIPFMYCLSIKDVETCCNLVKKFYFAGEPFKEGVNTYSVLKKENI